MRSARIAATVLLFTAVAAGAQVREQVTVEVVDVPVYVSSNGQPLRNLTKDDFELFVNGKRQQVDYFDVVDFGAAARTAASPETPPADIRARRLFLLIFDVAYSSPAAIARAQKAAVAMVDRALPLDLFGVVLYNSTGAKFIIPFTRDREVIRRAVLRLSPSGSRDALAISITPSERQAMAAYVPLIAGDSATSGPGASIANIGRAKEGENPLADALDMARVAEGERAKHLAESQLDEFASIASRMGELEGDKHAILFSPGFPSSLIIGALPPPGVMGAVPAVDPHMVDALQRMAKSFQAAGALFHTVDIGVADASQSGPIGNDTLLMFAAQTGGQFIHGTNDYAGALARLSTASSASYRLGFKPVNVRKGANTIDVKVRNLPRDATLSFRKGFSTTVAVPKTPDALLLADIIQNDVPQSGTPPSFAFTQRPFIDVIVPVRRLTRQFGAIHDADVMLYVFDAHGAAVDYREKKLSFPADAQNDAAIREKLALAPGSYVAKSLLRVGNSLGFAKVAFTVPSE